MGHGLVKMMLRERLGVIYSKGRNQSYDHLPNLGIPVALKCHYLFASIKEVLLQKL